MSEKKGFTYHLIKRKNLVFMAILFLFIAGFEAYKSLPKQEYPIVDAPMAVIVAVYPGASVEDMEELVTEKIEDIVRTSDGLDYSKSETYKGMCMVYANYETDLSDDEVNDSLTDLRNDLDDLKSNDLPTGLTYLNINTDITDAASYMIAFTGDEATNEDLVKRAEKLKEKIQNISGVSEVDIYGEKEQQINVKVSTEKLNHTNLSLSEISQIVQAQNSIVPMGTVTMDDDKIVMHSSGKFQNIDEIKNIIVSGSKDGAITKLGDIADITLDYDDDSTEYTYIKNQQCLLQYILVKE